MDVLSTDALRQHLENGQGPFVVTFWDDRQGHGSGELSSLTGGVMTLKNATTGEVHVVDLAFTRSVIVNSPAGQQTFGLSVHDEETVVP